MELVIGRIAKSHGIRGEVAVEVRTDHPDERFTVGKKIVVRQGQNDPVTLTLESVREHSGRLLVCWKEVPDRTAADALRGALLMVDSADLPPSSDPDEFYDHELEGLEARHLDGSVLGTVREVLHSAAGELLAVDADGREILIPFVRAIVPTVDVAGGFVVIDPPEGLLEV